jgi:hypothetical protein
MLIHIGDSTQPPFPYPPQPPRPQPSQAPQVQPMVYVYESPTWEYKVVARDLSEAEVLSEPELNELGAGGWELVGVATVLSAVRFYFKRLHK